MSEVKLKKTHILTFGVGDIFKRGDQFFTPVSSYNTRIVCKDLKTGEESLFSSSTEDLEGVSDLKDLMTKENFSDYEKEAMKIAFEHYTKVIDFEERVQNGRRDKVNKIKSLLEV